MRSLALLLTLAAVSITAAGCNNDSGSGDAGGGGDTGPVDSGPPASCEDDAECPGTYCNPGSNLCCVPATPSYEICGDRIDQNCDRRDESCGDNDRDGTQACRPGENPTGGVCDCDDERADVRPPFGTVPGATEACDGADNDCNGRIDESAACCDGCASLGDHRERADRCTEDGTCDCSSDPAVGPCAEGLTCCAGGCVDTNTDYSNCRFCGAQCTQSADSCVAGECRCGEGPVCDLDYECSGGACAM